MYNNIHNDEDQFKHQLNEENNQLIDQFRQNLADPTTGKRRPEVLARNYVDGGRYEGELTGEVRRGYGMYFFPSGYLKYLYQGCLFRRMAGFISWIRHIHLQNW